MSLFGRVLARLLPRRRQAVQALPAPERVAPISLISNTQATNGAKDQGEVSALPDVVILPGQDVPNAAPVPVRQRAPPDPAARARYFGYANAGQMPRSRQPALSWQRSVPEAVLPLRSLATGTSRSTPPGRIGQVEPIRFSAFTVWPEAAPEVPAYAASLWLTEPALLAQAVSLRDAVLGNAGTGGAPFRPQNLFDVAMRGAGHAGTALLLCHLVTKAFARGGNAVTWRVVDRDGGTFNDGVRIHRPMAATSDGTMPPFYALLAASSLGVDDTGDWYRFFALAAAALLAASGGCLPPQPLPDGAALGFARRVDLIVHDLYDPALADNGAYRGWRWANGLSFTEFALWGRSESRTNMAARIGVAAASFGLRMAGALPDPAWRWAVPRAGGWRRAANDAPAPIATLLTPADGLAA